MYKIISAFAEKFTLFIKRLIVILSKVHVRTVVHIRPPITVQQRTIPYFIMYKDGNVKKMVNVHVRVKIAKTSKLVTMYMYVDVPYREFHRTSVLSINGTAQCTLPWSLMSP